MAAADCLKADGNLEILGGIITAVSSGNAGDCLSADGYAIIGTAGVANSPVLTLATRGQKVLVSGLGQSADYANPKTFKAGSNLTFNDGVFKATTKNDGGEGLESKARLTINGGTIISSGTTAPEEGFDCDNNTFAITGGKPVSRCQSSLLIPTA